MNTESCSLPDAVQMSFRDGLKQNAWAGVAVSCRVFLGQGNQTPGRSWESLV